MIMKPKDFEERFVRQRKNVESLRHEHKKHTTDVQDLREQILIMNRLTDAMRKTNNKHVDDIQNLLSRIESLEKKSN